MPPPSLSRGLRFSLTVFLLVPLSVFQSCGCAEKKLRIAVIDPAGGLVYWEVVNRELAREHPEIQFSYAAPQAVNDSPEQAKMVTDAVQRKVDGILLAPVHQLVLVSAVKAALRQGIAVVIVSAPLAVLPGGRLAYVSQNDAEIGRLAADRMVLLMHHTGRVGIVSNSPTLEGLVARERAFTERIREEPHMVVSEVRYALSDWARARQEAIDLTRTHAGRVQGIFAADEFCTHGVISAFDQRPGPRPFIIGVAQESDQLDFLRQHRVDGLITTDPEQLARQSIETLLALRHQQHIEPRDLAVHLLDSTQLGDASVRAMH